MKQKQMFVLFLTIFLDMLGVGILIPVLPGLFVDPLSPHYVLTPTTSTETAYLYLGLLAAIFSVGQFFASPIIGQFSDKIGRKKLLAFSIFGTGLGHALFAVGIMIKSVPLLFLSRLLDGVTGGNIVVAQAAIADISTPENRAKNFGLIGAAFGLGFILGPFIGGKLADPTVVSWFNPTIPFWFAAMLSFANVAMLSMFLRETNHHVDRHAHVDWGKSIKNIFHAWSIRDLRALFLTNFLMHAGFTFYTTFAAVFFFDRFGFTESSLGNYFAYVGLWIVITQAFITRIVSAKISGGKILRYTLPIMGVYMIGIVLLYDASLLFMLAPIFSIAMGLTQANLQALLSRRARPEEQGKIFGLNGSVMALAMAIPPVFSGLFASLFSPVAPIVIAGMIIMCSALVFRLMYVHKQD